MVLSVMLFLRLFFLPFVHFQYFWYYHSYISNPVKHLIAICKTLYLRCLAGFWICLSYSTYLFENLPVPVKHEFCLGISLWKFGQIPGVRLQWSSNTANYGTRMIAFTKTNIQQKFIQGIRKCWKFLSSIILIPVTMHLLRSIGALILFLKTFKTKILHLSVEKKKSKWGYLAVNNLI